MTHRRRVRARVAFLVGVACLVASACVANAMPGYAEPYLKQVKTVMYAVAVDGEVTSQEVWEGVILTKNPSGSCTQVRRTGLRFVRDSNGLQPEYTETRRVIACPPSSSRTLHGLD